MGARDVVVAEGLLHVLVHFSVQGVEDVTSRAAHEVREAFGRERQVSWLQGQALPGGPVGETAFQGRACGFNPWSEI